MWDQHRDGRICTARGSRTGRARKGAWLRRFRHAEQSSPSRARSRYVRYRPLGRPHDDGSPRWDLYDACEELARRSWQGAATDGTTLSHEAVRGFLRETHQAAAAAGAVDLNLLLIDGSPVAFVYGYYHRGYVYGLRRGYDAERCRAGAGNVLLAYTLRDSFARGDRIYDMGVGSLESKRYFQTRLLPILRFSHFPPLAARTQLLRLKRWWQARRLPASIAVGRAQAGHGRRAMNSYLPGGMSVAFAAATRRQQPRPSATLADGRGTGHDHRRRRR